MTESALRPLGPHGEGYCTVCHFIEPLLPSGVIDRHYRGVQLAGSAKPCSGSYKKPPRLTPVTSRLAAFRLDAPTVVCPVCWAYVPIRLDRRIAAHSAQDVQSCSGGLRYPDSQPLRVRRE